MSTSNSFAYNTGSTIDGTTQVGGLSVGTPTSGYTNSPQFWNGPDQDLGYVIAKPVSGNTQPTFLINPSGNLTLSATYRGTDVNLSNDNQTAYQNFGYNQSVLGNTQIGPDSKVMFSVLCELGSPGTATDSHFIGIGYTTMDYNSVFTGYAGHDNQSMGYCSSGIIYYNNNLQASALPTWGNNDVIDIVVNSGYSAMWVRVNGGYWNNIPTDNPETNTGGVEIISGPFYPVLSPGYDGTMTIQNSAAYGVPAGYTLLGSNITASVGFWGTKNMTNPLSDATFIQLSEYVSNKVGSPQTFATAPNASTWLTDNGYWNSYGLGGGWYLYDEYSDAQNNGEITFPDHYNGTGSLNPNYVGQLYPGYSVQLYINYYDNAGTSYYSTLSPIAGNYGTLTLTQNSDSVTYVFTNNGFQNSGTELFSDNDYESSVPGSITILHPSSNDFNTTDVISISHTIFPSSYTFTIDSSMLNGLASVGQAQYGSANGTAGFTVSNQISNLSNGVYGQLNNTTGIESAFTAAGASQGGVGFIAMVQWDSSSDYPEGIAKVSYNSINQQFIVTSVDSTDNNFTIQNTNNGSNLVGTFNFPATFTIITPLITKSDWC